MSWRQRTGRLLLATIVPLAIVEGLLQAGAAVVAWKAPQEQSVHGSPCAVLCVGDSFTYGLGATKPEHAYPAQLEQLLKSEPLDGAWRVCNGGWPGRNTRNLLEELPRQIEENHPRFVAVLVGINDIWGRPEPYTISELPPPEPRRFRFEWRLPRLLALLFRGEQRNPPAASTSGSAPEPATEPAAWNPNAASDEEPPARGRNAARSGGGARRGRRQEAPPDDSDPDSFSVAGREAMRRREFARALEIFDRWVAAEPDNPRSHQARVDPAAALGRADLVNEELAWLRRRREEHPDEAASEALVGALQVANRWPEMTPIVKSDLDRYPKSEALWRALATSADREHDDATAETAIDRCLELGVDDRPALRSWKLRVRAGIRGRRGDLRGAQRDMLESWLLSQDDSKLRQMVPLHMKKADFEPTLLDQYGAELGATAEQVARAKQVFLEALDPKDEATLSTLEGHLRQLIDFCRRHGAEPVLVSYPFPNDKLEGAQKRLSQQLGVMLVDLRAPFGRLLLTHSSESLFVPDGHCTDLGYEFVAREVAAALRRHSPPDRK
jgi:lysophospholipase L1-like esterase